MKFYLYQLTLWAYIYAQACFAQSTPDGFTNDVNEFMKAHVADGRVEYARLKKSGDDLDKLYKQIGSVNLTGSSDKAKKAFYINAYNVAVIYQVVQAFPLKSPLDKAGFFDQIKHPVAGQTITLNQLEKEKLLNTYGDARVHFALVCAAVSCPPIADFAYTPDKLDAQLDERTQLSLNNPTFIRVNSGQKKVELSKLFDWYKADFSKDGQSVLAYINGFRREKIPAAFGTSFYEYDWHLNSR